MSTIEVQIRREPDVHQILPLPAYATAGAAGMDLYAALDKDLTVAPGERKQVSTGIRLVLPDGYEGQIRPRSGLALRSGLGFVNSPGTIDSDYRGIVLVLVINWGEEALVIRRGDRIAQLVVAPVSRVIWQEIRDEALPPTARHEGGFGHTGGRLMLPRDSNPQSGGLLLPLDQGLPPEAYALLAQANLLRMRGNWAVAIEKCMEALQIAPENASAQSLLGDIYENQGRLDDAIQWYRMALDVQPDSPADKLKLGHLLALKAQSLTPAAPPEPPAPKSPPAALVPFWDTLARYFGTDPDKLLRRAAFIAGSLALLIVFLAMAVTRRHEYRTDLPNQSAKQVNAPTVVVPTVNVIPDADPAEAAANADPAEQALQSALQTAPGLLGTGMTVVGVQNDPRDQRLTVTTVFQPAPGTPVQRTTILAGCLRVLQSASQTADVQTYSRLTVRCLLASSEGGSTPLVFIADADRGTISALSPNPAALTPDQIRDAFSNPWWSLAVPR